MNAALLVFRKYASIVQFRRAFYLAVLCLVAFIDFVAGGKTMETFVFYRVRGGSPSVETRLLPRYAPLELRVARYVEEALLGPATVDLGRLFPKGTRLESSLIRDGIAYVDLSALAALPTETEVDARRPLATLASGLERNFASIKSARIFIAGHEPFVSEEGGKGDFPASPKKAKNVDK
jgi:hypothetical protein